MEPKNKYYYTLIATTAILGVINLIIRLRLSFSGDNAMARSLGSIFGFLLAILVLYIGIRFFFSHAKGMNAKLSKKEVTLASLSVALLIYLLVGIVFGGTIKSFNQSKEEVKKDSSGLILESKDEDQEIKKAVGDMNLILGEMNDDIEREALLYENKIGAVNLDTNFFNDLSNLKDKPGLREVIAKIKEVQKLEQEYYHSVQNLVQNYKERMLKLDILKNNDKALSAFSAAFDKSFNEGQQLNNAMMNQEIAASDALIELSEFALYNGDYFDVIGGNIYFTTQSKLDEYEKLRSGFQKLVLEQTKTEGKLRTMYAEKMEELLKTIELLK